MSLTSRWKSNYHKFLFYSKSLLGFFFPKLYYVFEREKIISDFANIRDVDYKAYIENRVSYYNQLSEESELSQKAKKIGDFAKDKSWAYYLDMQSYLVFFNKSLKFHFLPGDVCTVPIEPTFVKSRPIGKHNQKSVLLKLNRVRHYYFVNDTLNFDEKKDQLVWRGACHQPHRQAFVEQYFQHPLCDIGDSRKYAQGKAWWRPYMSVQEQLGFKFILSIEGNDVATNLKWIMASNSLCFMTQPRYETWFMEGRLTPGYHYVELADDYSDLEEKVDYYCQHPEEAKRIIQNANDYVKPFLNHKQERLIGLLVMQKYFEKTGQKKALATN